MGKLCSLSVQKQGMPFLSYLSAVKPVQVKALLYDKTPKFHHQFYVCNDLKRNLKKTHENVDVVATYLSVSNFIIISGIKA
ncbi:hypothetical protein KHA80_13215 [Anaerobacillus sp. HL2]|nr:hypothetical protein KHA80_13215 [Anaerobacillus sp. HL2]